MSVDMGRPSGYKRVNEGRERGRESPPHKTAIKDWRERWYQPQTKALVYNKARRSPERYPCEPLPLPPATPSSRLTHLTSTSTKPGRPYSVTGTALPSSSATASPA